MGQFTVHWGNRLETMASTMFSTLFDAKLDDPLKPCCIVTNSIIMEAWLHHHFVFDWDKRHDRILANCSFQLLYPFINSWMDKLLMPADDESVRRIAKLHPYSIQSLQWRLYKLLKTCDLNDKTAAPLRNYLGDKPSDRRRFQLAGRLAVLYDDYQVYRCKELLAWSEIANPADWQQALWQWLLKDNSNAYAALFAEMRNAQPAALQTAFNGAYRRIAVFGTTAMPAPYLAFLQDIMAQIVDVDLYLLNPSEIDWFEFQTGKKIERKREVLVMQDHPLKDDPLATPDVGHPLLCSLGQAMQEHLDLVHQQVNGGVSQDYWSESEADTMLSDLQNRMLASAVDGETQPTKLNDNSIRIHICHNPRREVEVLHNHLLRWFTEDRLEPRQMLVLVTDMDTYAPLIDAVFGSPPRHDKAAIPYEIEGRPSLDETLLQNAFLGILHIASSRFQAPDMIDLLENASIMKAIGLDEAERGLMTTFISKAGIRWGIDPAHREAVAGVAMEAFTTWEYGLQRLLTGYALGAEDALSIGDATPTLLPVDAAEGASAETLGKLVYFMQQLKHFRANLQANRKPEAWEQTLLALVDAFFAPTNENYREIATIRSAILGIKPLTAVAKLDHDELPFEVIATFLDTSIAARPKQESLTRNAVIFGQLRPMNSRPAEVIGLLGLVDGAFPRRDNRPTFDLLKQTRHRGDRSIRRDDRCAFLEAILCARKALFISYAGRSDKTQSETPPSVVVQELRDYLRDRHNLKADANNLLPIETLHRMQGFNIDYFQDNQQLFSYSEDDLAAARELAKKATPETPAPDSQPDGEQVNGAPLETADQATPYTLTDLIEFFINPAKSYYRNVLDISLDIRDDGIADGDEPLAIGGLGKYQEQDELIKKLKALNFDEARIDRQSIIQQAKANAHAPLGSTGDGHMETLIDNTLAWLNASPPKPDTLQMSIKELLGQATISAIKEIKLGASVLTGSIETFSVGNDHMQTMARPATIKTKDRMAGWISHLFACADGLAIHTLIVGNKANRVESEYYQPIDADPAKRYLTTLVNWYDVGQQGVIPFTPETSHAYALSCARNHADAAGDTPQPLENPMHMAAAEWHSSHDDSGRMEDSDAWMFHAFGEDGPMACQHFDTIARDVFEPLLKTIAGDAAVPETSDAEGE